MTPPPSRCWHGEPGRGGVKGKAMKMVELDILSGDERPMEGKVRIYVNKRKQWIDVEVQGDVVEITGLEVLVIEPRVSNQIWVRLKGA